MFDGEIRKTRISCFIVIVVVSQREVARPDGQSGHIVPESLLREVHVQYLGLQSGVELGEHVRGRVCEGTTKPQDGLVSG